MCLLVHGKLLNLATRAKLHVALFIWWRWYFCWIPLSERCRIDLKIILFGWAELVFWINFSTHVQFVKVGQNSNVGSQAPKVVSHTLSHGYKKERHDPHFIIHSSHTSLSHLIGSYNLRGFSLLHTCEIRFEDAAAGGTKTKVKRWLWQQLTASLSAILTTDFDICVDQNCGLFWVVFDFDGRSSLTEFDQACLEAELLVWPAKTLLSRASCWLL